MKLNLLPSHVSKSAGSRTAFFVMFAIIALAGVASFLLMSRGQDMVAKADRRVKDNIPKVQRVMGKSDMADIIMAKATAIDRNLKLVAAMDSHNRDYTSLYQEVVEYIPSFYRINSISAAPAGEAGATVTMTGVLETSQQYADLVIALYRMRGVQSVTRVGFVPNNPYVPGLVEADQSGTVINPGETNLPSDPEQRMAALIQRASGGATGFQGTNFGTDVNPKGAMPGWSTVTVTVSVVGVDIRTPNPKATIEQHGSGAAPGGAPGGFGGFGGPGR